MIKRRGIVFCGPFNIVLSFTCCLRMTRRKKKRLQKSTVQLNLVKDTHFLGTYFLKKCWCQSCTETPSYFTITSKWKQKLKQIHIWNPLLAADNDWHVVWPQNLWLSVIFMMYFKPFGKKTKGDAWSWEGMHPVNFPFQVKKCLLLISIYTVPEWVGWKHIDIVVALHRCRLT